MQLVNSKYYHWYNIVATIIGAVLLVASLAALTVPGFQAYQDSFGLGMVSATLAGFQVIYGLFFYSKQAVTNAWMAALMSSMFLAMSVINLIHNTGQLHSGFLVIWGVQSFMSGVFGPFTVVGVGFLVTLYYIMIQTGPASGGFDIASIAAVLGSYALGFLGYLIWRNMYIDRESQQLKLLSGQLKSKEQQAEILIQSISDALFVITTEGKISLMNPAAAKMTEWGIDEASGLDARAVIKLSEENGQALPPEQDPFTVILSQQKELNQTLQLTGRNGRQMIVSLAISPIVSPKDNVFGGAVAVLRDISAQRAEEQRRADFISTASHEMRTPIAAIEGYLALALNDRVSNIDSKARSYLERAHASTESLGKLFQDLLTSAKAEDGRLVNNPELIDMGSYLEQLADSLRFSAEKKGLVMDLVMSTGANQAAGGGKVVAPIYYVYVDPERIREVITNLFDNAVKYTETGKITIGLTGDDSVVQLFIRDTGPGIPPDDIPHLFQKFYRVDNSSTRTIGGTGLGLFICRKIIELYNGRVWVESELGNGSTFYINLPRISSQQATKLQQAVTPAVSGVPPDTNSA